MKLLLCLAAWTFAAPAMLSLPALHLSLAAPQGWRLNSDQAKRGWVSFYGAKDPTDAAIDVFYYGRGEKRGTIEGYLAGLTAAERAAARQDSIAGRKAWIVTADYTSAKGFHTTKSHPAAHRRLLIVLGADDGVVVLRLQALKTRAARDEAVLRALASSIRPL